MDCFKNLKRGFRVLGKDFCHRWYRATFAVQWIGVLVVLAYTTVTALQYAKMKTATEAAKESADAAVAASRAWIIFKDFRTVMSSGNLVILQNYENAGKTPALDAFTGFQYKTAQPNQSPPRFDDCDKVDLRREGFDPPNIPFMAAGQPFSINSPLNAEETKLAQKSVGTFYIHECIRYHDVLSSKERLMELCADLANGALCAWNNQVK
ncbi:MAG: hypothetical protein ACLQAT_18780 [Candidatus Binataceae bacterium]